MGQSSLGRSNVFISYSHHDKPYLERLQVHLAPFGHSGRLDPWDDTKLKSGADWDLEIRKAIDAARVAIVLVSADFLASTFITEVELPLILAAREDDGLVIVPVIVSYCAYSHSTLASIQAENSPQVPLNQMDEARREKAWAKVAERVNNAINAIPDSPTSSDTSLAKSRQMDSAAWVREQIGGATLSALSLAAIDYLNLPRILWLVPSAESLLEGVVGPGASQPMCLRDLGLSLATLITRFRTYLRDWRPEALDVSRLPADFDVTGGSRVIRFDMRFRIKNIKPEAVADSRPIRLTGDLNKDPHMYMKVGTRCVYFPLSPRWITTDTAIGDFVTPGGVTRFAGMGILKSFDEARAVVSPLVIGIPGSGEEAWEGVISYDSAHRYRR